jgi:hypothetical protein
LFAGKRLLSPTLRCWRGVVGRDVIEAQIVRGGARNINVGHNRTDQAIGNRACRDVGNSVDDATHVTLLWRFALRAES